MKKIVHKSAAPIYAAAVVWVLYALLFPLYRPGHFVIALAASAVVYGIARLFCKDIVEEVPQEPETTGNQELDQRIDDHRQKKRQDKRDDYVRRKANAGKDDHQHAQHDDHL